MNKKVKIAMIIAAGIAVIWLLWPLIKWLVLLLVVGGFGYYVYSQFTKKG
jgi:4-hydroxybenzoate polyprenyltransferase